MSRLFVGEIVNHVQNIVGKSDTSTTSKIKEMLLRAQQHIQREGYWRFQKRLGYLTSSAKYSTGTIAVTQGAKTVTLTSGTFPTGLDDTWMFLGTDSFRYPISSRDSGTQITLGESYAGSTQTAGTYNVFKDRFALPADCMAVSWIGRSDSPERMAKIPKEEFATFYPDPRDFGNPRIYVDGDFIDKTYTTGTVTAAAAATAFTGSSTSWLTSGIQRLHKIWDRGTQYFTVKSVTSDTNINVYESVGTAISAGSSYTAYLLSPAVQLYPIPDAIYKFVLEYFRHLSPLYQNSDIPDIDAEYHDFYVHYAAWAWYANDGNPLAANHFSNWKEILDRMREKELVDPDRPDVAESLATASGRRGATINSIQA